MPSYSTYDPLARICDSQSGFFIRRCLPVLDRLVFDSLGHGVPILDLCCGTGELVRLLSERGFQVTGLDGSEAMIQVARAKTPDATFLLVRALEMKIKDPDG